MDESERAREQNTPPFLLCGMEIESTKLIHLENKLASLCDEWGLKSLKSLRNTKQFTTIQKLNRTKEIVTLLKQNDVKVLSTILKRLSLEEQRNPSAKYCDALGFILERFYIPLRKKNEDGIIFMDCVNKKIQSSLIETFAEFGQQEHIMKGVLQGKYKERVYRQLFFCDDKYSHIAQVTDLICASLQNAVWAAANKNELNSTNLDKLPDYCTYLKLYWDLFVKDSSGKVSGWGIKLW